MHELRKDILLGRWVAVLSDSRTPSDYELPPEDDEKETSCVLCPGREGETPREITSIRKPGTSANEPAGGSGPCRVSDLFSRWKETLVEEGSAYTTG